MFFLNKVICPDTGEDITEDFYKLVASKISLQRLIARKKQLESARLRRSVGNKKIIRDEKGNAIGERLAHIDPTYYHSVVGARKDENAYLRETGTNPWDDEEFLAWELKTNPTLKAGDGKEEKFFHPSQKALATAPIFNPAFNIHDKKYDL